MSAQVWAETDSQKAILIGKGGRMVREIGTAARKELERLGAKVFLDLKVRVRERWRRDEALLDRLGIQAGCERPRFAKAPRTARRLPAMTDETPDADGGAIRFDDSLVPCDPGLAHG